MTTICCEHPDCGQCFIFKSCSIAVARRQAHKAGWRTTPRASVEWFTSGGVRRYQHSDWCPVHAPSGPYCYTGEDETGHWAGCEAYRQRFDEARAVTESREEVGLL